MTFQPLALTRDADAVTVPSSCPDDSADETPAPAAIGHNSTPEVIRRTSVTLHLALRDDGKIHVTSSDMPYLELTGHEPRKLFRDVSGALCYEIRRRFFR